jgi:amino acid adenylation domain-containing protein
MSRMPPASFAQRRFWLLQKLDQDAPTYNLTRVLSLRGRLDADALHHSFLWLLRRHEALRTDFVEQDGVILQDIHEDVTIELPTCDLMHLPVGQRRDEALRLAADEGRKVFDLACAPLLRLLLIKTGTEDHLLVLVIHHIVTDGWSMSIIFDELAELYESHTTGRRPDLPPPAMTSSDFARWQQDHFTQKSIADDLAYWEASLQGSPEVLELPADHRRPSMQSHGGALHSIFVNADLTVHLKEFCASQGATLFMGLLAIFQVLLSRYSGRQDILVGTPVAGRNDPDLTKLIGCFVNTVVVRTDLSGRPCFQDVLKRVREVSLGAYTHHELPFEQLVKHLRPERSRSHAPLFQIMFVMQNGPKQVGRLSGMEIEELEFDSGLAKFDLTLEVVEQNGGLHCWFEYSTDLFMPATIAQMARHFVNLLAAALKEPRIAISRLPLLDGEERERILVRWNSTKAEYPRDLRIDSAFEAQVRRTPNDVALIEANRTVTYAELDNRANCVADLLIERNVARGTPVGVHLDRSADALAAILGILKAGCLWVPLDVAQPSGRLHRLVADCGCRHILTRRELRDALPETGEAILLDADTAIWRDRRDAPPQNGACGELAYIIYTSGSTGDPKGVIGTHRGIVNRLEWMYRAYPFAPDEVCCHKTALGFVDSIWEMFGPLLRGVPNVIISDDQVIDPEIFLTLLASQRVTRIVLVPTLLGMLLDYAPDLAARVPQLKFWTVSGEYLPDELARRFHTACPAAVLLNLYGASEVAADVTCHEVCELPENKPVPIGKPIANTQVYILDCRMQPVPIGVAGQIYVGGDCLSAGYWHRSDLTAERFVLNPFDQKASVLFATGDLGRFLPDGSVEFLGRQDDQVKIRGYRVELGEVESHLAAHPSVRQVAVGAIADAIGSTTQLVAYIVGRNGETPFAEELRAFLRDRLPQYMIPTVFVPMRELPLLPGGKVNRRVLPAPVAHQNPPASYPRPQSETEVELAAIWCELLRVPEVGPTQDFFGLGGHSLLAMQVLARVRRQFEVDVSIRSFFDIPTIEGLAREIEVARATGAAPHVRPIRPCHEPKLDALAAELAKLSPAQIDRLLRQMRGDLENV